VPGPQVIVEPVSEFIVEFAQLVLAGDLFAFAHHSALSEKGC